MSQDLTISKKKKKKAKKITSQQTKPAMARTDENQIYLLPHCCFCTIALICAFMASPMPLGDLDQMSEKRVGLLSLGA